MTTTTHHDRALNHIAAAQASSDHLADIYDSGDVVPRQTIAELNEQVRIGLKLAQIHAILDLAAAVRGA